MPGIQSSLLASPAGVRILVGCTFVLALVVRVLARVFIQRVLRTNERKQSFRYRIPLTPVRDRRWVRPKRETDDGKDHRPDLQVVPTKTTRKLNDSHRNCG